jgi:diguanylate cyclase (GGDEF)-like protein
MVVRGPTLPFVGIAGLSFAVLSLRTDGTHWWLVVADAIGAALVALVAPLVRWSVLPRWALLAPPVAADLVVAVLRHAQGGSTSGYSPLFILSAVWVGLTLRRREVVAMAVCTTALLAVPIAVFGAPDYPDTGWRGAVLLTIVAAVVGFGANLVVAEQRRQASLARSHARELDEIVATQTKIATAEFDLERVLDTIVQEAQRLAEADAAVVELPDANELIYRAVAGTATTHRGLRVKMDGAIAGRSLLSGETYIVDDSEHDARVDREACRAVGARSMVVVPLLHDGRAMGVLKVYSASAGSFGDATARVLRVLAGIIGTALVRAELMRELQAQAATDELTRLPNRRALFNHLELAIARARRSHLPLAVVVIDVDGLKEVNDRQGHRAGDRLLADAATAWGSLVREVDVVGRIGGDEFAIVLEGADERTLGEVIARLEASGIRASAGGTLWNRLEPAEALVARADAEMYAQKRTRYESRPNKELSRT